ncbi:hypothetical protein ASPBRDRAFT_429809 [Aspergillus brasiliensis CBS 101740]|uniref:Uncharacterized protein n=1 Tax=Aspergillus brasiliensis (strain CBS 101740 / IMI 381727 / IBT 21946) TaxID=767769 RepID=A0A1L9U364_ASPBC|nr:hypothetical protein ASPBRDRAFT_429809 [Aspergillus brasiliensis CBS 101740]
MHIAKLNLLIPWSLSVVDHSTLSIVPTWPRLETRRSATKRISTISIMLMILDCQRRHAASASNYYASEVLILTLPSTAQWPTCRTALQFSPPHHAVEENLASHGLDHVHCVKAPIPIV